MAKRKPKTVNIVWIIESRDDETGDGNFYPSQQGPCVTSQKSQKDWAAQMQMRHMASGTFRVTRYEATR